MDDKRRGSFGGRFTVHAPYICHIRRARRLTVLPTVRIACCTPLTLNSRASGICPGWRPPLQCDRGNKRWNIGARGRGEASRPEVDILCCLIGPIRRTVGPHVQTPAAVGWPICHPVLLSQTFLGASDCSSTNSSP
ncbi:hypothetical protein K443DRAFT_295722 [Laccaria amethystina LaAM-08-1]|uniref:Uncharacterized protein n=1 Tax=Laccaria amethystina LaAM-08-1 TaxID=1095629 RepID=A0A0C9WUR9_9AGAR|nr:hypothetical protein K443DRAFT_295722 [Laccaria amethystina LaAM-08-1]